MFFGMAGSAIRGCQLLHIQMQVCVLQSATAETEKKGHPNPPAALHTSDQMSNEGIYVCMHVYTHAYT